MLALLLALTLPPVTDDEAFAFHLSGRCQMVAPGQGITRRDGRGWIVSPLPGRHVIDTGSMSYVLDMVPGRAYRITAPGGVVSWCPQYAPPGRAACGPVPSAFLYDARLAGDR